MRGEGANRGGHTWRDRPGTALLALASALVAAWLIGPGLAPALGAPAKETTFAIATPAAVDGSTAAPGEIRLAVLIVDGVRRRWDRVGISGEWSRPPSLVDKIPHLVIDSSRPGRITFTGRRATAIFVRSDRGGQAVLEGGEAGRRILSLHSTGKAWRLLTVGFAPEPVVAPAAISLAVLLALLALVRPWRSPRRTGLWLLTWLILVHGAIWATQTVGVNSDGPGYLVCGRAYFDAGQPGYFPPGYPLLFQLAALLPLPLGTGACALQHLLVVLAVWWIYRISCRLLPAGWSLAAGLLVASWPLTLYLPQTISSETVALFGLAGCFHLALGFRERRGLAGPVAAGLLLAWSGLARISPLPAALPALILLMPAPLSRRGVVRILALGVACALPFAAALLYTGLRSGRPGLANSTGLHLYQRTVYQQDLLHREGPHTRRFLALLDGQDPTTMPHWETRKILATHGLGYRAAERLLYRVSLEGIVAAPLRYGLGTLRQAAGQLLMDPSVGLPRWGSTPEMSRELETPPPGPVGAGTIRHRLLLEGAQRRLWPVAAILGLAGAILGLVRWRRCPLGRSLPLALILLVAGSLVVQAMVELSCHRYTTLVVPFLLPLALLALQGLTGLMKQLCCRATR